MNIGIDARLLGEKFTGITRYLINVLKYLPKYDTATKYSLFSYKETEFDSHYYSQFLVRKSLFPRQIGEHLWLNVVLPKLLVENEIDLFFTPYILIPLKKIPQKKVIVIHDVMTKACDHFFTSYYKKYMSVVVPLAIKRCDAIVTVSESAKHDIIKYYNVSPNKISVMHLWTDDKYKPLKLKSDEIVRITEKYGLPDKFILFVGAIEERKNIFGILKISDILKSRGVNIKMVLIGNKGFGFNRLYDEIKKRNDRVLYLNYVQENELPMMYNLAKVFLFPSYYEGFGLPPLEAMKCGLPVLTSNNSSLIEVVGEGGILLDSQDYNSFAEKITSILNNTEVYTSMKAKALMQSEKFKPENEITKLIGLFNSLNKESSS